MVERNLPTSPTESNNNPTSSSLQRTLLGSPSNDNTPVVPPELDDATSPSSRGGSLQKPLPKTPQELQGDGVDELMDRNRESSGGGEQQLSEKMRREMMWQDNDAREQGTKNRVKHIYEMVG